MDLKQGNSVAMIVCSTLSLVGCTMIIFVYILFPNLKRKPSTEVVFYFTISNILFTIGTLVGEPIDKSQLCSFQAVIINIFSLSCILWGLIISYMMCSFVMWDGIVLVHWKYHILCWILPILVTFLPLINEKFGRDSTRGICWIAANTHTPTWGVAFWHWFSYFAILWLSIAGIVMYAGLILQNLKFVGSDSMWAVFLLMQNLRLYPLIIVIFWGIPGLLNNIGVLSDVAKVLPCLQGVFTALAFWFTHAEIREYVQNFFSTGHLENAQNGRISSRSQEQSIQFSSSRSASTTNRSKILSRSSSSRSAMSIYKNSVRVSMPTNSSGVSIRQSGHSTHITAGIIKKPEFIAKSSASNSNGPTPRRFDDCAAPYAVIDEKLLRKHGGGEDLKLEDFSGRSTKGNTTINSIPPGRIGGHEQC